MKIDFTQEFISASLTQSKEICQFFIDSKLSIDYDQLSSNSTKFSLINSDIFSMIYKNSPQKNKKQFLLTLLIPAIKNYNYDLVEFLLKENAPCDDALFKAVEISDLEFVNLILKYNSKPSLVNRNTSNGTALIKAINNNDLKIVKRLLSVPSINPNIYSKDGKYPLIIAFEKCNMEMINIFLDFYGDDLNNITEQLDKLLETLFDLLLSKNASNVDLLYAVLNRIFKIKSTSLVSYVNKYNLLIRSISSNNIDFITKLLQLEKINVNLYDPSNGDTPLIISIKENNFEAFQLLIQHPLININARNYNDDTALTIAAQNNLFNYINIIINNKEFDPEECRLNYAFYISKGDSVKKLLEVKELDVNCIFLTKENQKDTQNKYSFYKGPKSDILNQL